MPVVVYIDIVLAINLVMDYLILWTAARLGQIPTCGWRLLAGAAVGAVSSLTVLIPGLEVWLLTFLKLFFSILILLVAFFPLTVRLFFQALVYFYLAAFVMGGAMLGAICLFGGNLPVAVMSGGLIFSPNLRFTWLLAAGAAALLLARWGTGWIKRNFWEYMLRLPVVISIAGKELALKALVDTGNSLRDPLSQQPVIIVEYSALKSILPVEIVREYSGLKEPDLERVVASLAGSPWATRLRLLPYHSLGESRGLLLGFRPDAVIIVTNEHMLKLKNIVVGLCREQLSPQGNYRALLHPDLLQVSMGL
ncbi:MAG: sigma-E processing peptidase SpoIIGA [Clostridia bacterium]|nr:sigma-E processing peptidase SpoIIGA [Clostridia bacterium]